MSTPLMSRPLTLATLVGGALIASPFALAGVAHADPGTIKVHSAGTPFDDRRNEPKQACTFYISAFGVTAGETYRVTFEPQGGRPAGTATTATDTYTATQDISKNGKKGDGRTRLFNPDPAKPEILDGMYKVTAVNVDDPGDKKTKVFRLNCPAGADATAPVTSDAAGTANGTGDPAGTSAGTGDPAGTSAGTGDPAGAANDPGDVLGVSNPQPNTTTDRDNGPDAVGGVNTGGGGSALSVS